ncbi:MOSC domain-containing protein [Desulfofalx alkaliphila]|uniref:MOSC domain-containing protein n=1 Tax=Desulfofalx alkaliphila TaxID=105483 RepID=UPI0004E1A1CC|nr:MOSC domain-containing protein [Desulfofalx alkaliphila]
MGVIVAVNISAEKGVQKKNVGSGTLVPEFGLEGDAHGGKWHRQVSMLAMESIEKMRQKGLDVNPGDFAENITTEGIELMTLPIGTKLKVGPEALGEVTQIGKECHHGCAIRQKAGDCVMPREGIFIKVIRGGAIKVGDKVKVITEGDK